MRKSLKVYEYLPVPDQLPASTRASSFLDMLDGAIDGLWTPEIKMLMQPVGHPQSKRFFIQQYHAVQLLQAEAAVKGITAIEKADVWKLMSALRRVAHRRGIAPQQLLIGGKIAAE